GSAASRFTRAGDFEVSGSKRSIPTAVTSSSRFPSPMLVIEHTTKFATLLLVTSSHPLISPRGSSTGTMASVTPSKQAATLPLTDQSTSSNLIGGDKRFGAATSSP